MLKTAIFTKEVRPWVSSDISKHLKTKMNRGDSFLDAVDKTKIFTFL